MLQETAAQQSGLAQWDSMGRAHRGATCRTGIRHARPGIAVSNSGFTHDALVEAERSREPIKLMDRDGFIRLLLEHYEALDPEYKAQIPLSRV